MSVLLNRHNANLSVYDSTCNACNGKAGHVCHACWGTGREDISKGTAQSHQLPSGNSVSCVKVQSANNGVYWAIVASFMPTGGSEEGYPERMYYHPSLGMWLNSHTHEGLASGQFRGENAESNARMLFGRLRDIMKDRTIHGEVIENALGFDMDLLQSLGIPTSLRLVN